MEPLKAAEEENQADCESLLEVKDLYSLHARGSVADTSDDQLSEECCGGCTRFQENGIFSFRRINNEALADITFKGFAKRSADDERYCERCLPSREFENRKLMWYTEEEEAWRKGWRCCRVKCDQSYLQKVTKKRYNPIWTGNDANQIGVFVRDLRVTGLDLKNSTVGLSFKLTLVWLDEALSKRLNWRFVMFAEDEYKSFYKEHMGCGCEDILDRPSLAPGSRTQSYDKFPTGGSENHQERGYTLPKIKILNSGKDMNVHDSFFRINDPSLGRNTVQWCRDLHINQKFKHNNQNFPFGYQTVELKIELQRSHRHLVLLRNKRWYNIHKDQVAAAVAAHTFAYINADNSFIQDWRICSVYNNSDRWYSKYDDYKLNYSLMVKTNTKMYSALIVIKRSPQFGFYVWFCFTFTTAISLFSY